MERRQWREKCSAGNGSFYCELYQEKELPKRGVVLVLHGMQSNSTRYVWMAERLAGEGFVAVLEDINGHGRSQNEPGSFGEKDGWRNLVRDVHRIRRRVNGWFPGLPVYVFGHSMGSFLAREYARMYPQELDGLMLCGTGGMNPLYFVLLGMIRTEILLHGSGEQGLKIAYIMAKYFNRNIPAEEQEDLSAWTCKDRAVREQHKNDPLNVGFTLGAYRDMMEGIIRVCDYSWAESVPPIPVYIMAGGADPVGQYGKGPAETGAYLHESGHDVTLKIYPARRHEILNEIREESFQDMNKWFLEKTKLKTSSD